jgi:hypothetical protein
MENQGRNILVLVLAFNDQVKAAAEELLTLNLTEPERVVAVEAIARAIEIQEIAERGIAVLDG